jgi:RNA polymerase sigma-70 factor (ECF subfamily)
LGGFVWRIAERLMIDRARRARRTEPLLDPDAAGAAPAVEAEVPDVAAALRCGIDLLPADFAEALRLTAFSGLSQEALARRLGLSATGARSRVQRARAALRRLLADCCRFEFDRRGRVVDASDVPCGKAARPCCGDGPAAIASAPAPTPGSASGA